MSEHPDISPDLIRLFNDALNGVIDDAGTERLQRELLNNEAAQSLFLDYCALDLALNAEARARRVIAAVLAVEPSKCNEASGSLMPVGSTELPTRRFSRVRSFRKTQFVAVSVAIAILAAALYVFRPARPQLPGANVEAADQQDVVTVNLASADTRWLPIKDVGSIFVQGPAQFELMGTMRAKLVRGRVRVHITDPRGHGFVLETPRGEVKDLGTEFGVDVADDADTGVVVFEGAVDLSYYGEKSQPIARVERLTQGEGLTIKSSGAADRIMSIVRGDLATFRQRGDAVSDSGQVIVDVADNIRAPDVRNFYEIVPGGFKEDALAYVDRPNHDWSGVDARGLPAYLIGADYVKPFNGDKMRSDVEIVVTLAQPARLFVFFDQRVLPPQWLQAEFRDTGDVIGHDAGPYILSTGEMEKFIRGEGPGESIDSTFGVWERIVDKPGVVRLGPNGSWRDWSAMYGIAAVPLGTELHRTEGSQPSANAEAK
jgi:hypothetical protein